MIFSQPPIYLWIHLYFSPPKIPDKEAVRGGSVQNILLRHLIYPFTFYVLVLCYLLHFSTCYELM